MNPTKEELLELLNSFDPIPEKLITDLNGKPQVTLTKWMARSEAQWKEFCGLNGIDIYNFLNRSSQKQKTSWTTTSIFRLEYDPMSEVFELNPKYLADSGLPDSGTLLLYCRPIFHQQFKFLQRSLLNNAGLRWILGPPGTGKSTTTLAFASTLDSNTWVVTWIHLRRKSVHFVCVRYERGTKMTCTILDPSELDAVLNEVDGHQNHIVFVDGFAENEAHHSTVMDRCSVWLEINKRNRRLVVVCSMSARGKTNYMDDMVNNVEDFFVYSWKLDEYLAAAKHDAFFNNVKSYLGASGDLQASLVGTLPATRADLIKSKFYFAGGCARFMFLFNTAVVIDIIEQSIAVVEDIIPYIKGTIGDMSNNVINRLFCSYRKSSAAGTRARIVVIVSEWAASALAMKHGPDLVKNLAGVARSQCNPSMDGWMFEMWFFALLRHGGVEIYDRGNVKEKWTAPDCDVLTFAEVPPLPDDGGVWLKPAKWNQGGYDAIYIDQANGLVRFVQVTRGSSHSFKIEYFYKFLQMLRDSPSSFEIATLEIVFVVLQENSAEFKISEVSGQGLLADFGWEKGKEEDYIRVAGICGWE